LFRIFILFCTITLSLSAQFNWLFPEESSNDWRCVDVYDNNTIWLGGDHGAISISNAGGENWTFARFLQNSWVLHILALSETEAIAVQMVLQDNTSKSYIIRTQDAGSTWQGVFALPKNDAVDIKLLDNGSVVVLTESGFIISDNKRESWREVTLTEPNDELLDITTFTDGKFWIISARNSIYESRSDATPVLKIYDFEENLSKIIKVNDSVIYILASGGKLLKTYDSGSTWNVVQTAIPSYGFFTFTDENNGYLFKSSRVYGTSDGGLSWELIQNFEGEDSYITDFKYLNEKAFIVTKRNLYSSEENHSERIQLTNREYGTGNRLHFLNSQYGFRGLNGKVLRTTDSGFSWEPTITSNLHFINRITSVNVDTVFAYVGYSSLYKSFDKGETWVHRTAPDGYDLEFPTAQTGYIVGEVMSVQKTTDGGMHWIKTRILSDSLQPLRDASFVSENEGWAVGGVINTYGIVVHTSNGSDYEIQHTNRIQAYDQVKFINPEFGCVKGLENWGINILLATTDGGETWNEILRVDDIYDFHFFDAKHGIVIAGGSNFFETFDGGTSWKLSFLPTNTAKSIVAFNDDQIWIYADNGMLSTLSEPIIVGIENKELFTKEYIFSLNNNYPNPFNPTTTITFTLPGTGKVVLKVFNVLGQEVTTLVDATLTAGEHNVEFDGAKFSSGIYFYQLITEDNSITKKMVLIK